MEAGVVKGGAISGPVCAGCGGPLARDQRYCLNCGRRAGKLRIPGPQAVADSRPGQRQHRLLRVPAPRSASALAALTLGFGVFIGLAMSPAFENGLLAGGRFILELPQGAGEDESAGTSGDTSATLGSPVGNVAATGGGAPARAGGGAPAANQTAPAPAPSDTSQSKTGDGGGGNGGGHHGLPPRPPEKPTIEGTVVHVNPVAKSYSVATDEGQLIPVHDAELPDPGTEVKVGVRVLFNGTYAERDDPTTLGESDHATFAGNVTHVDPEANAYTVSVPGASVLVHAPAGDDGTADLPELANEVSVDVGIDLPPAKATRARSREAGVADLPTDSCTAGPQPGPEPSAVLTERSVVDFGPAIGAIHVEGTVERSCQASHELDLSADDIRESDADLSITAPEGIDLDRLELAKAVSATVAIDGDDSYALTGVSSDDGETGADDSSTGQGDQAQD